MPDRNRHQSLVAVLVVLLTAVVLVAFAPSWVALPSAQESSGLPGLETVWSDWTARDISRNKSSGVSCPEGKLPINGGYELAMDGTPGPGMMFVATQDSPSFDAPGSWYVHVRHVGGGGIGLWALRTWAICITAN